jgi:P2-related tail formation protein
MHIATDMVDGPERGQAAPYFRRLSRTAYPRLSRGSGSTGAIRRAVRILSCTLIVTEPTKWMLPYHDRMPVLLQQAEVDRWLSGAMKARELHPVSESSITPKNQG